MRTITKHLIVRIFDTMVLLQDSPGEEGSAERPDERECVEYTSSHISDFVSPKSGSLGADAPIPWISEERNRQWEAADENALVDPGKTACRTPKHRHKLGRSDCLWSIAEIETVRALASTNRIQYIICCNRCMRVLLSFSAITFRVQALLQSFRLYALWLEEK